jgi:hypothetical protein
MILSKMSIASFPFSVGLTKDNVIVSNTNNASDNKIFNLCMKSVKYNSPFLADNQSLKIKYVSDDNSLLSDYEPEWIQKVLALLE